MMLYELLEIRRGREAVIARGDYAKMRARVATLRKSANGATYRLEQTDDTAKFVKKHKERNV